MTAAPDLDREIRRMENDVSAIYEMLASIQLVQVRHGNRLVEIDDKLLEHDARFDAVDRRLEVIDRQVGEVLDILRAG